MVVLVCFLEWDSSDYCDCGGWDRPASCSVLFGRFFVSFPRWRLGDFGWWGDWFGGLCCCFWCSSSCDSDSCLSCFLFGSCIMDWWCDIMGLWCHVVLVLDMQWLHPLATESNLPFCPFWTNLANQFYRHFLVVVVQLVPIWCVLVITRLVGGGGVFLGGYPVSFPLLSAAL